MSCCEDLRFHLSVGTVVDTGHPGLSFVVFPENMRRLAPISFCPWCGTELRPKEKRPLGTLYKP